jgi:hypothetical protein
MNNDEYLQILPLFSLSVFHVTVIISLPHLQRVPGVIPTIANGSLLLPIKETLYETYISQ